MSRRRRSATADSIAHPRWPSRQRGGTLEPAFFSWFSEFSCVVSHYLFQIVTPVLHQQEFGMNARHACREGWRGAVSGVETAPLWRAIRVCYFRRKLLGARTQNIFPLTERPFHALRCSGLTWRAD